MAILRLGEDAYRMRIHVDSVYRAGHFVTFLKMRSSRRSFCRNREKHGCGIGVR